MMMMMMMEPGKCHGSCDVEMSAADGFRLHTPLFQGDFVRQWVPELQGIKGGDVHAPWTLSTASLSHAHVSLGETYPTPIGMAPEWSRHVNKKPVSVGGRGSGQYDWLLLL